jgi:hypothetical protein
MANAVGNVARGAGTENMDHYRNCKKIYVAIDNIHVMRDSLTKMCEGKWLCKCMVYVIVTPYEKQCKEWIILEGRSTRVHCIDQDG